MVLQKKKFLIEITQKSKYQLNYTVAIITTIIKISKKITHRKTQNHISIIVINQMYSNCNNLFLNAIEGSGLFFPQKEKKTT